MGLYVSFAGRIDNGSSLFEHREKVGIDERLGEEVLCRAEKIGALPLPSSSFVVASVAGPDEEVASLQTTAYVVGE